MFARLLHHTKPRPFPQYARIHRRTVGQMAEMKDVERLSPACVRIMGGNPGKFTLGGTNTYLIGTGRRRLLLDSGEGREQWIKSVERTLKEEDATVDALLISHWHLDHTGGIKDFLALSPDTKVYKNRPEEGQLEIADGQTFSVEGATLTAHHTPGHTNDHMVFVLAEEDAMFTADNVLGQGTAVFESLGTYLASLDRMQHLFRGRAYPGHGPVVADGPARVREYMLHRKQREDQVVRTLRTDRAGAGAGSAAAAREWTAMELVKVIYADVPEELHVPACGGVLKILAKLEEEGKVSMTADGERWACKDQAAL